MATTLNKLTAKGVLNLSAPGHYGDGGGLYLAISERGQKSWVFIWKRAGKRKEMGLGAFAEVSLAEARTKAISARDALTDGKDPVFERDRPKMPVPEPDRKPTFGEIADEYIDVKKGGWRGRKTLQGWERSLQVQAMPLRPKPVDEIDEDAVIGCLSPLWLTIPVSAVDLRERIEKVLGYARAKKLITGPWENPARWKDKLEHLLPRQTNRVKHHRAIHWSKMPAFMAQLGARPSMTARALEFCILTASRETMVLEATWGEVNGDLWTIPGERMKEHGDHVVPLTKFARSILDDLRFDGAKPSDIIFKSRVGPGAMSNAAMDKLLALMEVDATPHGFRSTFRDWAGDCTEFPREVAEAALSHAVGDQTERAYRRGKAIEKRRKLMDAWADFCLTPPKPARPSADTPEAVLAE
jgi:integrase